MFTVEMDHDEIVITVLDDTGENDDLHVYLYDDCVFIKQVDGDGDFIKQVDSDGDFISVLQISPDMWGELMDAINSPEGAFIKRKRIGKD